MTFAKPSQNLAIPQAIRERLDLMFAGQTGLSGKEMVKYFSKFSATIEQYDDRGGMPSRKQILQDCLANFDLAEQKGIIADMLNADIYHKYAAPADLDRIYIQQWISDELPRAFPQNGGNVQLRFRNPLNSEPQREWDVFISHASEDKVDVATPLAGILNVRGLRVWFDSFSLTVGDSLRRSIDNGLSRSRFGIVILSESFFSKHWPQLELDGLVARESNGQKVILPVWHEIDIDGIKRYSPTLADRLAVSTERGIEHVAEQLMNAIHR